MTTTITSPIDSADCIDVTELERLRAQDPDLKILDVRTGGEFETVHIPGAYNVPLDTLAEHARDLADVAHPVVLVCQSGSRADQAHQRLSEAGKDMLHILEGGMASWEEAGGEVIRGDRSRWAMDRQVRLVAGSMGVAGVAASVLFPPAKWIAAGVGAGLSYSAVSNTCAMANILSKLPYNRTDRCDIQGVLNQLQRSGVRS